MFLRQFAIVGIILCLYCAEEKGIGPELMFNPFYHDDFYSFPFPNDFRKKEDGRVDMSAYPVPYDTPIIGSYPSYAESVLRGSGTNSPEYTHALTDVGFSP